MTTFANWLTPEITRTAAMTILHFLWQGAALAALASAAMALFRSASARYAVGVAMLAIMVAAPLFTFALLQQRQPAPRLALQNISVSSADANTFVVAVTQPAPPARHSLPASPDYLPWLVQAWLVGVLLLSLRPAAGFIVVERMRRKQAKLVGELLRARCLSLQNRLGLARAVRYCACLHLEAPAVIGWFRPVVFLPLSVITGLSDQQLDAVIAHELAHIKRLDAFVNLFQIAAETLLFYHPAVWWLSKRIRVERENCCDDVAISVCGNPASYASALASMAEWQAAPTLAMAANRHPLAARVARILGIPRFREGFASASLAASVLCLSASLLAGHALFGAARTANAQNPPVAPTAPTAPAIAPVIAASAPAVEPPSAPTSASAPVEPTSAEPTIVITAPRITSDAPAAPQASAPQLAIVADDIELTDQDAPTQEKAPVSPAAPKSSFIDGFKSVGLDNLSIDELMALKIHGVTPDYVRELQAAGIHASAEEIVAMKIHGISPAYLKDLENLGIQADADHALAMKIQGVTSDYVRELRTTFPDLHTDQIIAMKIQGVKPEYLRIVQDAAGAKPNADEIIAMKIQGVSPEYIRELQALGLKPDIDQIIAAKIQGVTADYVKALQGAGLHFDTNELIAARIQGVTPEFIARVRSHGFKDLDLDKLIRLKLSGVLDQ